MVRAETLWPGATVFCVASGPSLTVDDLAAVKGRGRFIAVNDAIRIVPWADVLYSSDRGWWRRSPEAKTFAGLKYGIGSKPGEADQVKHDPDVRVLRNTGESGLETDPSGLKTGRNSGTAAINLAVHLGASQILLLGYDMGRLNGRAHFFEAPVGVSSPYADFRKLTAALVKPLNALGVRVYNCSPQSHLTCFPKVTMAEALDICAGVAA